MFLCNSTLCTLNSNDPISDMIAFVCLFVRTLVQNNITTHFNTYFLKLNS